MSFSRQITLSVILTLIISGLSTVFCALSAKAEEPLSTMPVVQGPKTVQLPAIKSLVHKAIPVRFKLPKIKQANSAIITAARVEVLETHFQSANANTVIEFAKAQIGDPYVWGGNGPNGWDCSGLMVGAFRTVGVNLPRTSRAQFTVGSPVSREQLAPGDLLFFGSSAGTIHHVALYIGNGQIIHASTFGVPVKIDTVKGGGNDYFGARRII